MSQQLPEGFEVFDRRAAPAPKEPFVTIQKGGLISFNRAAYQALGEPEAIELLYNRAERIIGFRKADPKSPRSYPMREQNRGGSHLIAGTAFLRHYEINMDVARRYQADTQDNIVLVDLKRGGTEATGVRARRTTPTTERSNSGS
jgi:hypothetical protein